MAPWAPLLVLTGLVLMVNGQAAPSGSAATTDYGFTINMKLPYPPELADQNSPQFAHLSNRIKPRALQLLQTLLPDCTAVTVSSFLRFFPPGVGFIIEPPPEEGSVLAKCLATFPNDNHTDEEVQRAFDQTVINNSSMLGDIEVLFSNPSTAAPSTSPGTAPNTSSGNKPGRKSKRPYPRRTARSRTRPKTSTSDSSTTSRPSTVNVWSRSTTSASNNTERSSTGSQPSMEGSSVTAKPSTVRVTGILNTEGGSDITNIPTGKSKPTAPQNTEDVTLTSTSTEIISSTTLRNPRTFPPSGEVFAATVQFKVENVTTSDNMEVFKRIVEDQLLKVFESNPDFISAQVALLRQGSVYVISILYFLHRAPSNQAIVDVLSKYLKENNMYLGPFKIDLRSIRSGDAVPSDHRMTPKPGSNSEASLAITRSTDTSTSAGEPGISGSQGSGMGTGPPNSISTTGLNESQKNTPGSGGPSVPGVTIPSTTHDAVPSDRGTTPKPGLNSETRSTVASKSAAEPGISGSQGSGMGTGPPNESQKSTPGLGGPTVPGVTIPSTTHGGGSVTVEKSKTTSVTTANTTITTAVTTGTTTTAASAVSTPSTNADTAADSEEGTFPMYGQVLLGLLAAGFVLIPSVMCLAAYTNLLGRFS